VNRHPRFEPVTPGAVALIDDDLGPAGLDQIADLTA